MKSNGFILVSLLAVLGVVALGALLLIGRGEGPKITRPGMDRRPGLEAGIER
jgi:hypothetical protein